MAQIQRLDAEGDRGDRQHMPSLGSLLRTTFEKWYNDSIPRHAAALAFYTLFAIRASAIACGRDHEPALWSRHC